MQLGEMVKRSKRGMMGQDIIAGEHPPMDMGDYPRPRGMFGRGRAKTLGEVMPDIPAPMSRADRRTIPNSPALGLHGPNTSAQQMDASPIPNRKLGGLFGSGRRQAMQRPEALPEEKSNKFFGKGGIGRHMIGSMSDVLLQHSGNAPIYGPAYQQQQQMKADADRQLSDRQWQFDMAQQKRGWNEQDAEAKRNATQSFMSGKDRVQYDPVTGQSSVVYDGPEPFEAYAASLGLTPGSPEHTQAMQDYVLRSSGPTAYGFDVDLDNVRTGNDIRRKGSPTYRQSNPLPKAARRPRRASSKKPVATNEQGQQIEWNGSAWVAVR